MDLFETSPDWPGEKIVSIEEIPGGRNSRVFRAVAASGQEYLVKRYLADGPYHQDRAGVEFKALDYLWSQGVREIPQPVYLFREKNTSVFTYIKGEKITPAEAGEKEIQAILNLLASLHRLAHKDTEGWTRPAADACFSLRQIIDSIWVRINRLSAVSAISSIKPLQSFLEEKIIPTAKTINRRARTIFDQMSASLDDLTSS